MTPCAATAVPAPWRIAHALVAPSFCLQGQSFRITIKAVAKKDEQVPASHLPRTLRTAAAAPSLLLFCIAILLSPQQLQLSTLSPLHSPCPILPCPRRLQPALTREYRCTKFSRACPTLPPPLSPELPQYTMGYCFKDHTLPHFESTHGGISMQQIKQNYLIYLGKCTQNSFAGGKKATKNPLTDKKEIDIKSGAMVPVAMAFVAEHGLAGLVRANVLDLPLVLALMLLSGCWRLDESLAVGRNGGNPVSAERLQALLVLALIDYSTTLAVVYAAVTTVLSGQPAAPSATNGVVAGTGAAAFALPSTADIVSGNYGMDGVKATAMRQKVAENHAAPVAPVDAQFRMDAHALGRGSAQVPKRRAAGSAPLPSPLRQCTADGAPVNRALHAEFEVAAGELDIRYLVVDFSSSMQAQTTVAMFVGDGGLGSSCLRTDQLLDACGYVATAAAVAADDAGPDLFSTLECPDVDAGNEGTFIEEANIILDILDDNGNVEEDAVWLFDRQMIELAGQLDGHPIPEPAWLAPPMPMAAFRNFYARTLIVPSEHDRLHIAIVNTIEGASASVSSQQSSAGQHWFMAAWLVSRRDDASPHAAATTSQPMAAAAAASNVDADSDTDPSDGVESEPEYEEEMTEVCPDLNTLGSRM